MGGLTLCMIVRDEQDRLPRCLASVAGLVDELIVVDTGSTDDSVRIAREHGAVIIDHDFSQPDFARARNCGLDAATGEMVFVLDADEVLLPESAALVRELASRGGDVGWFVTRHNVPDGGQASAWVDYAVRLFPNRPDYRFRARVHETVDDAILAAGGRLLRSDAVIEHRLSAEPILEAKWRWYIDLLHVDLAQNPDDADRLVFLMADHYKLKQFDEATAITQRIAALCPADFTAQFQAALCTFVHGREPLRAQGYLADALAIRPQDPEALELAAALEAARGLSDLADVHGRHPRGAREQY